MRKYEAIRTEIKKLSDLQKVLKPQRKQSYKGEITPGSILQNKYELRHLFQAYAILKGVKRSEIKKPMFWGVLLNQEKLDIMVEKYRPIEVIEDNPM